MSDDLILMPEVEARRALTGRPIRLHMLVPYGSWIGCGALRVLRLKIEPSASQGDSVIELVVGYESYTSA